MPAQLTNCRLDEISLELRHDLWPPVADIEALVEEVKALRAAQRHGAMRNRMYPIGEDQVVDLDQVVYAHRYKDRLSVWLAGVEGDFVLYDQQFTAGVIDVLWDAIKYGAASPEVRGGNMRTHSFDYGALKLTINRRDDGSVYCVVEHVREQQRVYLEDHAVALLAAEIKKIQEET